MTETSTALEVYRPGQFLVLNHDEAEIREIMRVNFGNEEIDPFSLPRTGMPTGGSTRWELRSLTGPQTFDEIVGVIVHTKKVRAYWPGEFQGSTPPACSSPDALTGYGNPGGPCHLCPLSKFGPNGERPECKLTEQWFVLRENARLPLVLNLPPGSLKNAKDYRYDVADAGLALYRVVTAITLGTTTNDAKQKYSYAIPRVVGLLPDDEGERARAYGQMLAPVLDRVPAVDGTDPDPGPAPPAEEDMVSRAREAFGDEPGF